MKRFILFIFLLLGFLHAQFDELKSNSQTKQNFVKKPNLNISLVLEAGFAIQSGDPEEHSFPGFIISEPEGRIEADSFYLGHNELCLSGNIDDWFFGQSTIVYTEHEGVAELELEEFFIETIGLGYGATIRVGRFLPTIGYLNEQHLHNDIFVQRPLVYQAFLGGEYSDDGVQASIVLPTKTYIELGLGAFAGRNKYPANSESGAGLFNLYARVGGDFNQSSSWRFGISYFATSPEDRVFETHHHHEEEDEHEDEEEHAEEPIKFTGDSNNINIEFKYQWAPNGNQKDKLVDFRFEWFSRNENGVYTEEDTEHDFDGTQTGFYLQVLYKWQNRWGISYRFDSLAGDAEAAETLIEAAGKDEPEIGHSLEAEHNPVAHTIQLEYQRSEFSRIRVGLSNLDLNGEDNNNIFYINFTTILGDHAAHKF